MSDTDDTFLARWSRRKLEAKQGAPAQPAEPRPQPVEETSATAGKPAETAPPSGAGEAAADPGGARALAAEDFKDVDFDALDAASDYTPFMKPGVPDDIRAKALQKLWLSDPTFARIDEFHDYHGDFTDAAVAVAGAALKTAHRVGRGFLSDEEVAAWERLGAPPEKPLSAAAAADVMIGQESPDQPEIAAFLAASNAYAESLYPPESNHLVDLEVLTAPGACFLVARRGGTAVGCGALVLADDGSAELKRMWVTPEARGSGIGRALLAALEAAARNTGVTVLRLETGVRQAEAIGLYRSHGFAERGPFGSYQPDPLSLFMEKPLDR